MAKVICTLPNAADLINGVVFTPCPDGMISEDITDEQAENFASIPGYQLVASAAGPAVETEAPIASPADEEAVEKPKRGRRPSQD